MANKLQNSISKFLKIFSKQPRILHIGNIANNAYNNAKLLNNNGFDCDLILHNYYHIMACPEWEDAEIIGKIDDFIRPNWTEVDLQGFKRPTWFAQGPLLLCVEYLKARREGKKSLANKLWKELGIINLTIEKDLDKDIDNGKREKPNSILKDSILRKYLLVKHAINFLVSSDNTIYKHIVNKFISLINKKRGFFWLAFLFLLPFVLIICIIIRSIGRLFHTLSSLEKSVADSLNVKKINEKKFKDSYNERKYALINQFIKLFPDRQDVLTLKDFDDYFYKCSILNSLFEKYDLIIAYSTDAMFPLLINTKPYIAFEHGTIRDIPFENSPTGRFTALAYAEADFVYLTNADSLARINDLKIEKYVCGLHGFSPDNLKLRIKQAFDEDQKNPIPFMEKEIKYFFGPARQHWSSGSTSWCKGNDLVIKAVASLSKKLPGKFKVIFVEWGAEIDLSKQLINDLGITDYFIWVPQMEKADLLRTYSLVDGIFDQFLIPCIGGITFEAIAIGNAPVITLLDDENMKNFYGETIPLFNCSTATEIEMAMTTIITNPGEASRIAKNAHKWFLNHHSGEILKRKLTEAIIESLNI